MYYPTITYAAHLVIVLAATCLLAGAVIRALNGSRSGHARPPGTNEERS